ERHFSQFRKKIIGNNKNFQTPYGLMKMVYADWTASGRLYAPIEENISKQFGPFVGNTHTSTTVTGTSMTLAYHKAHTIIKDHVNASDKDVIITSGSGMTRVVNKFQRILGLKCNEKLTEYIKIPKDKKPVVFITHMEHHSNQTTWLETIADVEIINSNDEGLVDLNHLNELLKKYSNRKAKIAAVTACSNVTGIQAPYFKIAEIMHKNNGLCFVDFACSAPYVKIDMHPKNQLQKLDAIYFSPHKFLGGPGSTGVLIFDSKLYKRKTPDQPGGGTVRWTDPYGSHLYFKEIELREDGGTPAFLQTIKAALAIKLKEKMGIENMLKREHEIVENVFNKLKNMDRVHILESNISDRLAVFSFFIEDLHYNLAVKLLNDHFGIQTRGGCSCAGTYGHYLLHLSHQRSKTLKSSVKKGDLSNKPGWVRISFHPTMSDKTINYILDSLDTMIEKSNKWSKDYEYNSHTNEFHNIKYQEKNEKLINTWFEK
ncbi:MAG: aminotransferase class V-fold PLP-dependent enzyme, partial [Candidatus Marinimicrobia bacterium]|nr:aminotransferase class V-fold PLP-dependent enzyme [Candidatus Neomarinimicrobiota bacterium]